MMRGASSGEVSSGIPSSITPERVLLAGMLLSGILIFSFDPDRRFTGDELAIISLLGDLEPRKLFEPYVGHLVTMPLVVYWAVLNLIGPGEYVLFKALTFCSILLLSWVLFLWGRKRVPAWVAVAPALLILIFPQDTLHYLYGNGFFIVFALACGLGSLLFFERGTRGGDIAAFTLLLVGMMTYTVAVPFAIGILIASALKKRWGRLWISFIPLLAYLVWRLTLAQMAAEWEDASPDWGNLLVLPAWIFQATGLTLAAILGLGFDFLELPTKTVSGPDYLAPVLAALLLIAVAKAMATRGARRDLLVVTLIGIGLFSSQVLVWGTFETRATPKLERYLYPNALIVLMLLIETARGISWGQRHLISLWTVTAISLIGAIGFMANTDRRQSVIEKNRAEILAIELLESSNSAPPVTSQNRLTVRDTFDAKAGSRFGYLGLTEPELLESDDGLRSYVDSFLVRALDLQLATVGGRLVVKRCTNPGQVTNARSGRVILPASGAILFARQTVRLRLGRYGNRAREAIGTLRPGPGRILRLNPDDGSVPWFITAEPGTPGTLADLVVCRYRKAA